MEPFSYAYLYAIASSAGYSFKEEPRGNDNVGIDITMNDPARAFQLPPARISAQVKCTTKKQIKRKGGKDYFRLEKKNYDTLIQSKPGNTYLLLVVIVPQNPLLWIIPSKFSTIVRYKAYWVSLEGLPKSTLTHPKSKIDVELRAENLLTPSSLIALMDRVSVGEI